MRAFPFEVPVEQLQSRMDELIDAVWESLQSHFLELPKGEGWVPYERFRQAYDVLYRKTEAFNNWATQTVVDAFREDNLVFVVVRTILGFSPPEWAHVASTQHSVPIDQNVARQIDRQVREDGKPLSERLVELAVAMLSVAVEMIARGAPSLPEDRVHRLDRYDTKAGAEGVAAAARLHVPYPVVLYERFLGRPFASHRDAVSELIGDIIESAIERVLDRARITYHKTKRAEKVVGFDQAPDYIVPDLSTPAVVIEAKITEDDGTARDKVTRIQHLAEISARRTTPFELIACIDGRGFAVRREDMRKLIMATKGKVFTLNTIDRMVEYTKLRDFRGDVPSAL